MSEHTLSPREKNHRTKRVLSTLFISFLVLTIGTCIYFLDKKQSENKQITASNTELKSDLDIAQRELETVKVELESMKGRNTRLDSLIEEYLVEIEIATDELNQYADASKLDKKQIKELKNKIAVMQTDMNLWIARADSFSNLTIVLTKENAEMQQTLVFVQEKATEITKKLTDENQILTEKVRVGSLLEANELEATAVRYKGNDKEAETSNADKAESIKVSFVTDDNDVIDSGAEVTFLVRLIGPDGATIAVEPMGSGYFELADGEEKMYTVDKTINYANKPQEVNIYWSQNSAFAAGEYTAIVYQNGYEIGETTFELRDGLLTASR